MERPVPNLDKINRAQPVSGFAEKTEKEEIAANPPPKAPVVVRPEGFVRSFLFYLRKKRSLVLIGAVFLFGLFCGAVLVRNSSGQTLQLLNSVLGGFLESRRTQSFFGIMASSFSSLFLILAVLFFCGFCSIAQPVVFAAIFFRGLGHGFSIGMLYYEYSFRALGYTALLMTPSICLGAVVLMMAGRVSIKMSTALFSINILRRKPPQENRTKTYCIKYALFALLALFSAMVEAALFSAFGGLFVL